MLIKRKILIDFVSSLLGIVQSNYNLQIINQNYALHA